MNLEKKASHLREGDNSYYMEIVLVYQSSRCIHGFLFQSQGTIHMSILSGMENRKETWIHFSPSSRGGPWFTSTLTSSLRVPIKAIAELGYPSIARSIKQLYIAVPSTIIDYMRCFETCVVWTTLEILKACPFSIPQFPRDCMNHMLICIDNVNA